MEALDVIFGLDLFEFVSEDCEQGQMIKATNSATHNEVNFELQTRHQQERSSNGVGLDLGRSGFLVFSPQNETRGRAASADFEEELALQSLTSQEFERQVAHQALESNVSTATDASIASCSTESSDVSEYSKALSELAADGTTAAVKKIDSKVGMPFMQHLGKINEDRSKRGLTMIDISDAPSLAAPPSAELHRTCSRKEANAALRSLEYKNGGKEKVFKEVKKAGEARGKEWIDWFLLKLAAIGLVSIGVGYAVGVCLVGIGCSATFALVSGLIVACGFGFAGYTFFLATTGS